jgi:hypothetical protein
MGVSFILPFGSFGFKGLRPRLASSAWRGRKGAPQQRKRDPLFHVKRAWAAARRQGAQFCARRKIFNRLGSFFCNGARPRSDLGRIYKYTIIMFIRCGKGSTTSWRPDCSQKAAGSPPSSRRSRRRPKKERPPYSSLFLFERMTELIQRTRQSFVNRASPRSPALRTREASLPKSRVRGWLQRPEGLSCTRRCTRGDSPATSDQC